MLFFSNPGPKYTPSSNRLNTGYKLIILSSVTKGVHILSTGNNKLYSSHREKKEGTSMWNAWVLWVFLLPHASNFIMKTEKNSTQRQLDNSSIIQVEAAISIQNHFLTLYSHKELHHRCSGGPRSTSGMLVFCAKHYQKRLKFKHPDIYMLIVGH